MIIIGLAAAVMASAILLFISHVAPRVGGGNFIRDLDQPRLFGKQISRREGHLVGILVFILTSSVFGALYGFLVTLQVVPGFGFLEIMGWGLLMALFFGGVILPLEGHGVFGVKEDAWFPVDLVLTNVIWALLFWWIVRLWPYVSM